MIGDNFLTKKVGKFPLAGMFWLPGSPRLLNCFVGVGIEGLKLSSEKFGCLCFQLIDSFLTEIELSRWNKYRLEGI